MNKWLELLRMNKLFIRILLYFLSLVALVIVIGVFSYTNFVNEAKREYNDKIAMNLASASNTVDSYLQTIHESSVSFFGDPAVARLLKPRELYTDEELADLYLLPQSVGRTRFGLNRFIDELFVYADDHSVFTASGINGYDAFFDKFYVYEGMGPADWQAKLREGGYFEVLKPMTVRDSFGQKRVVSVLAVNQSGRYPAAMVATIRVSELLRTMDVILGPGVTRVVVTDGSGGTILSSDPEFPGSASVGRLEARGGSAAGGSAVELNVGGAAYTVSAVSSDLYNWKFYAFTPVDEFRRQASGMLNLIVGICLLLCVIGCLFSFIFSFKIYNPIRKLGEVLADKGSGLSWEEGKAAGVGDLERIGSGIHQLISYRHRYQDELQTLTQEYLDHALYQLMNGSERRNDQNEELLRTMRERLSFQQPGYVCVVVSFEFLGGFYSDLQDVDRIVIQSKLKKVIAGLLKDFMKLYVVEARKNTYLCVVNLGEHEGTDSIERGLDRLIQTFIQDWAYCRIHIGIGHWREGMTGITRSYREALAALQTINDQHPFRIAHAGEPKAEPGMHFTFADENRLLNLLKVGDKPGLTALAEEMLDVTEKRSASFSVRTLLLGELYGTALRYAKERGIEVGGILAEAEHAQLAGPCELPAELQRNRGLLVRFMHGIVDHVAEQHRPPGRSSELALLIRQYVEENYASDLYLESIAEQMNVSMKYASRVFKAKFEMNLTDYISLLRIEKAKALLAESELSVGEIAEQVGFFNRTTFLRTFKRIEGVSPNDYRKASGEDERNGA